MTIVCVDDYSIALEGLARNIRSILPKARVCSFQSTDKAWEFVKDFDHRDRNERYRGIDPCQKRSKIKRQGQYHFFDRLR